MARYTKGTRKLSTSNEGAMPGQTKHTGTFEGKSNKLGHGGRAAQLKAKGVPQAVIGQIARSKGAAPGQRNYHPKGK
jgi:hypothetical protein